jgi:8-oxo-dGTP pyrophosphatase MutT (NUDIX family)
MPNMKPKISDAFRKKAGELMVTSHKASPMVFGECYRKVGEAINDHGKTVSVHIVPSTDAIVSDGKSVVLISRTKVNPLQRAQLPGGWVDHTDPDPISAALRELKEETTIDLFNETYKGHIIRPLKVSSKGDFRTAYEDLPERKINKGDVFLVATQPVRIEISTSLMASFNPKGEDDAEWAGVVPLSKLDDGSVNVYFRHLQMIKEAGFIP